MKGEEEEQLDDGLDGEETSELEDRTDGDAPEHPPLEPGGEASPQEPPLADPPEDAPADQPPVVSSQGDDAPTPKPLREPLDARTPVPPSAPDAPAPPESAVPPPETADSLMGSASPPPPAAVAPEPTTAAPQPAADPPLDPADAIAGVKPEDMSPDSPQEKPEVVAPFELGNDQELPKAPDNIDAGQPLDPSGMGGQLSDQDIQNAMDDIRRQKAEQDAALEGDADATENEPKAVAKAPPADSVAGDTGQPPVDPRQESQPPRETGGEESKDDQKSEVAEAIKALVEVVTQASEKANEAVEALNKISEDVSALKSTVAELKDEDSTSTFA